jgi:hypothetical protein
VTSRYILRKSHAILLQHYLVTVPEQRPVQAGQSGVYYRGSAGEPESDDEAAEAEVEAGTRPAAHTTASIVSTVPISTGANARLEMHTDPAAPLPLLSALALTSVQLYGMRLNDPR